MRYPVVVFGVKDTTKRFVEYLNQQGHHVDLVVTISEALTRDAVISGYSSMHALPAANTEVFEATSYTLDDAASAAFFKQNTFGIGLSMGWSRLIPKEVLDRFDSGVFGLHGSCGYLPFGQGRATLNWSLIRGDWRYVMHLFKLDQYPDSPNIYAKEMFEVNEFDDIRSLQYKDLIVSQRLVSRLLRDYAEEKPLLVTRADNDGKQWYRGRTPEDGRIDIAAKTREIYNLIRGVTRPFPGAFAFVEGQRLLIWAARPFDRMMDFSDYRTGEIIDIFDENILMRTVDGSLLITDYYCEVNLKAGNLVT
ncbi:MAG: hypothetical protein FWD65_07280 [Coriobacteriia bacterium]|nr:hypothetical protein [Coriobacteriia bacterium]